ncbi:glycosyltransferase [Ruminococcus sp. OM05-10BH]|nr:glycosyltransferase [Ruminococcus sp. OM05-10BH]
MEEEIVLSVIVPVYKVEKYLSRCVDSLIQKSNISYEVILVDDESPDQCPQICDAYTEKYKQVYAIHKKNGGLSDARNTGMKCARGEYILFVDSDDDIQMDTYDKIGKFIDSFQPDIIVGNAKKIVGDRIEYMQHTSREGVEKTGQEFMKTELYNKTMYMAAWLNIYKKDFLQKNKLQFKKGILHEDEEFTPRCFLKAEKVVYMNHFFYNYRIRENSITTNSGRKNAEDFFNTCYSLDKIYKKLEDKELKNILENELVDKYLFMFQKCRLYRSEDRYLIKKDFLKGKSMKMKTKIKSQLFLLNPWLYFWVNEIIKSMLRRKK